MEKDQVIIEKEINKSIICKGKDMDEFEKWLKERYGRSYWKLEEEYFNEVMKKYHSMTCKMDKQKLYDSDLYTCSVCDKQTWRKSNYCPNCGRKVIK